MPGSRGCIEVADTGMLDLGVIELEGKIAWGRPYSCWVHLHLHLKGQTKQHRGSVPVESQPTLVNPPKTAKMSNGYIASASRGGGERRAANVPHLHAHGGDAGNEDRVEAAGQSHVVCRAQGQPTDVQEAEACHTPHSLRHLWRGLGSGWER